VLDGLLELTAGAGQQGGDPLGGDLVGVHELLASPLGQADAEEAVALLQADELRDVGG